MRKITKKLALWGIVLAVAVAWPGPGGAAAPLSLPEVENRLVRGGYLDTLYAAQWAVAQGEAVIPLLSDLLDKGEQYRQEGGSTGAFPFNVLWALAHLSSSRARQALEKYFEATHDPTAALALKGWRLRNNEQSPRFGVLLSEGALLEAPREKAQVVKKLKAGQQVKIMQEKIVSPKEVGPRGGPQLYDRVELVPSAEQGYIPRAGDDFSPFI
jgi:hypothetical protein